MQLGIAKFQCYYVFSNKTTQKILAEFTAHNLFWTIFTQKGAKPGKNWEYIQVS